MEKITLVLKPGLGLNFEAMRPALQTGAAVAIGRGGAVIESLADGDAPGSLLRLIGHLQAGVDTLEQFIDKAGAAFAKISNMAEQAQTGSPVRAAEALGLIEEVSRSWAAASKAGMPSHEMPRIENVAQQGEHCPLCHANNHSKTECAWFGKEKALAFVQQLDNYIIERAAEFNAVPADSLKPGIFDVITGTADQPAPKQQNLPSPKEHAAQIERVAADLREHGPDRVQLKPCGFCGGPPVQFVQLADRGFGAAPRLDSYGDDGLSVEAFVSCHECGARGPIHEDDIFDASDYDAVLKSGVDLWQSRDERHADLYLAGEADGLNLFPRPDVAPGTGALCVGVDVATDRVDLAIHNWAAPAEGGDA